MTNVSTSPKMGAPKKKKAELRVQLSTWTTQSTKKQLERWQAERKRTRPWQKMGDTLAEVVAFAESSGFQETNGDRPL